jgi:hypothetical protein
VSFARPYFLVSAGFGVSPSVDKIDTVDEMRALRTNRIWSKGRVEYTPLADTEQGGEPSVTSVCSVANKKSVKSVKSVAKKFS